MSVSAFGIEHGDIAKYTKAYGVNVSAEKDLDARLKRKRQTQGAVGGAIGGVAAAGAPGASYGNKFGREVVGQLRHRGVAVTKPQAARFRTGAAIGGAAGRVRGRPLMAASLAGAGALGGAMGAKTNLEAQKKRAQKKAG